MARLAVFSGGCTVEAVVAVCRGDEELELHLLESLATLLDESLLVQEKGPDGDVRYRMLDTIHEYASEQLDSSREVPRLRERHGRFFLNLAEQAYPELNGPREASWLERLEADQDNLRAALLWSRESNETELRLRLAGALWRFWFLRSYFSEGRRWLEEALAGGSRHSAPDRSQGTARRLDSRLQAGRLRASASVCGREAFPVPRFR